MLDYRDGLLTTREFLFKVAAKYEPSSQEEDFDAEDDVITFLI